MAIDETMQQSGQFFQVVTVENNSLVYVAYMLGENTTVLSPRTSILEKRDSLKPVIN